MECWPSSAIATVWWAVAIPHLEVAEIFPRDCARVAEQRKIARREDRKVLAMRKTWRRRRDSNLGRFAGVSEAGARCRNSDAKRRTSRKIMVPEGGLEPPHPCGYMDLNHARLPIPPLRHEWMRVRNSTRDQEARLL